MLAPWLGLRPALYLRSLTQRHPRRLPATCPTLGGCAVFLAIGRFLAAARRPSLLGSCLSCAAARGVTLAVAPTAPLRAHTHRGRESLGAPTPRAPGRGGPRCPSCSSPARYARARQGPVGLRESGVRLRRAFLSADAIVPSRRLSLLLRVRYARPAGVGNVPPPPAERSCVLSVLGAVAPRALPAFWLVGSRAARRFCPWVSNGKRYRLGLVAPDHRTTPFPLNPPCGH